MATTVAAMKARLGDTDYFILSMKAQELTDKVKVLRGWDEWENMSIEERYQRDLNYTRVRNQIAPYLANNDSRFFGSIIVAAMNFGDEVSFEPLSDISKGLPGLYKVPADTMGFLTFSGGEVLIPLDGQHRLRAIQFAISGLDEKGRDIERISAPCTELAKEDVTVILVPYDPQKARKIFTHVNLYAKKPTTGQNIVTNDDDIFAIFAREVTNDLIGSRLVKFTSNTLRRSDESFTTITIIYNCNQRIIEANFPVGKIDKTQLPDSEAISLYRQKVRKTWGGLLENIDVFADALSDIEKTGDDKRREIRESNLLGRPVGQECLVRAFVRLTNPPNNMSEEDAYNRLNHLPWEINDENLEAVWDRVLWTGGTDGRIITKETNRKLAIRIIAYLAGEKLDDDQKAELLEEYRKQFPAAERESKQLPENSAD